MGRVCSDHRIEPLSYPWTRNLPAKVTLSSTSTGRNPGRSASKHDYISLKKDHITTEPWFPIQVPPHTAVFILSFSK